MSKRIPWRKEGRRKYWNCVYPEAFYYKNIWLKDQLTLSGNHPLSSCNRKMQSWKRLYGWLISSKKKYPNFVVNGPSDLKLYSQFSSLQKSIQQAQQQLAMLNMAILQKQQTISTLMALQLRGVTMEEITGLTKILIWIE